MSSLNSPREFAEIRQAPVDAAAADGHGQRNAALAAFGHHPPERGRFYPLRHHGLLLLAERQRQPVDGGAPLNGAAVGGEHRPAYSTSFENYSEVLAKLGYPVKLDFTSIFPKEGGNLRLLSDKIGEKKAFQQWIGIAPFSAHKGKTYPLELMEKVVAIIVSRHPSCRIFFFGGGREEMEILDNMASKSHNCVNASGLLSGMRDELILMSHLDVMVSMDSANMHMASLVNCPVVSIWGATHPYAGFVGWGQKDENFVQLDMPCRPCSIYGSKPCMRGDYACLSGIAPEIIADKVESLL